MLLLKITSTGMIALLLLASGVDIFAKHEQKVKVQVGKTATESHSKIRVEFVELIEDSRCPTDTNCVWAGNAKIKIRVTKGGKSQMIELNSGVANKGNSFAVYEFKIVGLTPEPRSNIRINRNGYVAVISMTRQAKGS